MHKGPLPYPALLSLETSPGAGEVLLCEQEDPSKRD